MFVSLPDVFRPVLESGWQIPDVKNKQSRFVSGSELKDST